MTKNKPAGDEHMGKFVYCIQHVRVHATGWCTVDEHNKVALPGTETLEAAEDYWAQLWRNLQ